jgi:hypothetical protein
MSCIADRVRRSLDRTQKRAGSAPIRLVGILLVGGARSAGAQGDPTIGPGQFPQFRNLSGLSGGGYGVDSQGYSSLSGPTAFSTPIAHVLGRSHLRLEIAKASFRLLPDFSGRGSNGTALISYGQTVGRLNILFSDMFKSGDLDQSYNCQIQYIPSPGAKWVGSIGVQDWNGNGGAAGTGVPGDNSVSRSVFGVVTYRWDTRENPVYLTLGAGRHRFRSLFGSVSYQVSGPMRTWAEYDGFGVNLGVLLTARTRRYGRPVELNTTLGLLRGKYFFFSVGTGF